MPQPKVIFVVGHSNWGKSQTLCALTSDSTYARQVAIADTEFAVRRMSNDDQPESFINFMDSLAPDDQPNVIAALCPNFENPRKGTAAILETLRHAGYRLYFWVMEQQYGTEKKITSMELSKLGEFGRVELFSGQAEAADRAKGFVSFIERSAVA